MMKKIVLFLLISTSIIAQENKKISLNQERFNTEASIVFPFGKLANKFNYAQSYGFWFKLGEDGGFAANIGINALFLKTPRPIEYQFKDSIYKIKSSNFGLDVGIRVVKVIPIDTKNYLELNGTFAVHYLDYDFPKDENDKNQKKNNQGFANTTILIAPQLVLMHQNVGLKIQYRFTPYNLIDEFESRFGSQSIAFGIVYKQ